MNNIKAHEYISENRIILKVEYSNDRYWAMSAYKDSVIKHWMNSSFILSINIPNKHICITTDSIVMNNGNIRHSMYLTNGYRKIIAGYIITRSGYDNNITISNGIDKEDL